jgi:hypothetical protein
MNTHVHLYWLRESGCDLGTPLRIADLDPVIQQKVAALAAGDAGPLTLQLPFFDRRESRRRAEILRGLKLVREGDVIRSVPATAGAALRDYTALLLSSEAAWMNAPDETDPGYFAAWQKVSLALQRALRQWIPATYFRDAASYEDRPAAYPLLVYEASRLCHGRPRTEFTYDIADPESLPRAMYMIGQSLQRVLVDVERRLFDEGRPELARRYAPIWYEDILRAVRAKPRPLMALLGDEALFINAVIDLGSARKLEAVKPFARTAKLALRTIYGMDLRALAAPLLKEATKALQNTKGANG